MMKITRTQNYCISLLFVPIFSALSMIPTVEAIAPFTGVANLLIFIAIIVVVFLACVVMASEAHKGFGDGSSSEAAPLHPSTSLLFFSTVVYCLNGIPNLLPVENSLADPEQAFPIVFTSMGIVFTSYLLVGLLAHLAWPHTGRSSITAHLSAEGIGGIMATLASASVIFSVKLLECVNSRPNGRPTLQPIHRPYD